MLEEHLIASGDKLFSEGKFSGAEESYKEVSDLFLRNWNLGIMHFSLGEYFRAYDNFLRAFENASDKSYLTVKYGLGKTQYELGDYIGARENLERIVQNNSLSEDVREDAEKMLERMKFGVINKLLKRVKNIVLKNPLHSAGVVFAGGVMSQFNYETGFDFNGRDFPLSIAAFLISYIGLKTLSKRFTREKRKDAKLDSLLKFGKKEKFNLNDFLTGAYTEFKSFYSSGNRALGSYSIGGLIGSHQVGMTLGLVDLACYYSYKFLKKSRRNENLPENISAPSLTSGASAWFSPGWLNNLAIIRKRDDESILEKLSTYSIPISAGVWFSLGLLNNFLIKEPNLPLFSIAYLSHLTLKSLDEGDLFKGGRLEYVLGRLNKISLIGGLISAGVFQKLQIEQFNEMLGKIRPNEIDSMNFYNPTNLIVLTALSSFLIKHTLISFANQEFKSNRKFSLRSLISKPFVHYPITLGLIGGCLGLNHDLTQSGISFSEKPLSENAHSFLLYSVLSSLSATFLGYGLRKIESLSDYVNYFKNKSEGKLKEAIEFYKRIVERPCSILEKRLKHLNLGELLVENGDLEGGFNQLREVDKVSGNDMGFFGKVFHMFRTANLSSGDDVGSKRRLALLHSSGGDVKEAGKLWKECLSLDDSLMENCLYAEFLTKNRLKGADEQWRRVIEMIAKQPYETEGLDSTHVVKHIKGRLVDYVLKFGSREELNLERDLTGRLSDAVRNHHEFIAPDPLTVFNDENRWILATRYQRHKPINIRDISLLKKLSEYMHLIYSLNFDLEESDEIGITNTRAEAFVTRFNDSRFRTDLVEFVLSLVSNEKNGIFVTNTDPSPKNWGRVDNRVFRCDIAPKGKCHPYLELSRLLCLTDTTYDQKEEVKEEYIEGFRKSDRVSLGGANFSTYLCLRAVQVIPRCFSTTVKVNT